MRREQKTGKSKFSTLGYAYFCAMIKPSVRKVRSITLPGSLNEHISLWRFVLKWLVLVVPVGITIGSAIALFLSLLTLATQTREQYPSLLYFLPIGGIVIAVLYRYFGASVEQGSDLIVDEIHKPGAGVPRRMAPLIFVGTLISQLLGGSVGREGPAVQMGGSISSLFGHLFKLGADDMRLMLMAGIAAGFGAVFGTPLAGAIFALEVLAVGTLKYDGLLPCLIASVVGDLTCRLWGIHQVRHIITASGALNHLSDSAFRAFTFEWDLLWKVAIAAIIFGLASRTFSEFTHGVHRLFKESIKQFWLRPVVGGLIIIGLTYALGTRDYLGLGISSSDPHAITIESAFSPGGAAPLSWFWKLLFTVITLGSGFKGGEVTPMFFIGATLGNVLAGLFHAPVELFAGIGLVAVFAGATNTPLAGTLLSVELFGSDYLVYFAVAIFLAYLFSGHSGVYLSQRIGAPKGSGNGVPPDSSLGTIRKRKQKPST